MKRNRVLIAIFVLPFVFGLCLSLFCGCQAKKSDNQPIVENKKTCELAVMACEPITNHRGTVSFDAVVALSNIDQPRFTGTFQVWYEYGVVNNPSKEFLQTESYTLNKLGSVSADYNEVINVPLEDIWYKAIVKDCDGNIISSDSVIIPVDLNWLKAQQ